MDGLHRVNGDVQTDKPENQEMESPPHFQASPSNYTNSTEDAPRSEASAALSPLACSERGRPGSVKAADAEDASEGDQRETVTEHLTPPCRPSSLPVVSPSFKCYYY